MTSTRELEEEIYQAAVEARRLGIEIKQCDWVSWGVGCCPLTALVLKRGLGQTRPGLPGDAQLETAADDLLPERWTAGTFAAGFDGEKNDMLIGNAAFEAGRSVGRRLGFTYDDSWMEPDDERD